MALFLSCSPMWATLFGYLKDTTGSTNGGDPLLETSPEAHRKAEAGAQRRVVS
ncbi:hypothetical protein OHU34_20950 [Streptomyces sp. NBC_00080]|uniref:hypothetical protein n=1 Tax=unclassified Streptomyces TaxID=2593676 RepID=UPI00135C719D|nr:hypothetical protein [Streptomyces sp. SLBN-115]